MSDIILPRRSQVYTPGDDPYQSALISELSNEKLRWELGFIRLENAVGVGTGQGTYRLSNIYPNAGLEAQGFVPVTNYTDSTDVVTLAAAPWSGLEDFPVVVYQNHLIIFVLMKIQR